jgi:hypothetical protein
MPAKSKTMRRSRKPQGPALPPAHDWRTTDEHERERRAIRAREERHMVRRLDDAHPVFTEFEVASPSGLTYRVEIRDLATRRHSCTCRDFRINGLDACKHTEAVLNWLKRREKGAFRAGMENGSPRIDLVPSGDTLRVERNLARLPPSLRGRFDIHGNLMTGVDPEDVLRAFRRPGLARVSQETDLWLAARARRDERVLLRREYETGVAEGRLPAQVTRHPLYPYQREGMLHLAFSERALLADEMGLGKTIQAIAACALLRQLGKARRVLVVTPASLKAEWEAQIRQFTDLGLRLVYGGRGQRLREYANPDPAFFTIVNYEQVVPDSLDINARLKPDIVVLDEAQRIKNWATKTAQAVKRLESRYAFVLTGTPIENRIDELYSIVDYLDPAVLGPLFRFNREFYRFDDNGRPSDYQNLPALRERVRPVMLRRRKAEVETELPGRTDRNHLVRLTPAMQVIYDEYRQSVAELVQISLRRPLTKKQQDLLMILLAMMRMCCDTPSIIRTQECADCPKMDELARVVEDALSDPDVKIIIFSEWEGMLARVKAWAEQTGIGFAWHTGSVPQQRRRGEIMAFNTDPKCHLFLSTDSGGVGLNLQVASVVINCDLPWNPAKLEQRIARAWRKKQRRTVTVVNLVAENTIEHGMLDTLANKANLADGVLDGSAESLGKVKLKGGPQSHLARLRQILAPEAAPPPRAPAPPADPAQDFARRASELLRGTLARCEECLLPDGGGPAVLAVLSGDEDMGGPALERLFKETDWRGATPALRVVSGEVWSAMQSLAAAGLVTLNLRCVRPLSTPGGVDRPPPPLTADEQARVAALREQAGRRCRVAALLASERLTGEAVSQLQAGVLELAQARAITLREPLPDSSAECCAPRFAALWGRHAESIRLLIEDPPRVDLRELAGAFREFDQ